jgi:hypothetical protein
MRKGLLIASVLLGTVITGSAQTSQKASSALNATASQSEWIGNDLHFSGNVVLVLTDGAKITADAATFHPRSNTVDFTGSVRLTMNPPK